MVVLDRKKVSLNKRSTKRRCIHNRSSLSYVRLPARPLSPISDPRSPLLPPPPPRISEASTLVAKRLFESKEKSVGYSRNRPFSKLYSFLAQLELGNDIGFVKKLVLDFSLKIYGLPKCCIEDLPLAVYFFIEEIFGIKSKIELCVPLNEGEQLNIIGVVFETIGMKYDVLKNDALLEGTEVRMKHNTDLQWILDALDRY